MLPLVHVQRALCVLYLLTFEPVAKLVIRAASTGTAALLLPGEVSLLILSSKSPFGDSLIEGSTCNVKAEG